LNDYKSEQGKENQEKVNAEQKLKNLVLQLQSKEALLKEAHQKLALIKKQNDLSEESKAKLQDYEEQLHQLKQDIVRKEGLLKHYKAKFEQEKKLNDANEQNLNQLKEQKTAMNRHYKSLCHQQTKLELECQSLKGYKHKFEQMMRVFCQLAEWENHAMKDVKQELYLRMQKISRDILGFELETLTQSQSLPLDQLVQKQEFEHELKEMLIKSLF
jgi:hypothetical protein